MENVLIVTVGMRDIQVTNQKELNFRQPHFTLYENKNVPGYKLFAKPYIAGASIISNKLTDFVEYPIIKPAIDFFINKGKIISDLILICTDQKIKNPIFTDNDTIYFTKIIAQLIRKQYAFDEVINIHDLIVVETDVNNYGVMYDFFNLKLSQIIKNQDNCNLYIFPQGGINAINFGALLKSIELFPNTYHLCKSEANSEVEISDFPYKFRTGIERQNIFSLIDNFYYHEVFSSDPFVKLLSAYAEERLRFNYKGAYEILHNSNFNTPLIDILKSRALDLYNQSLDNEMIYLKDFYLSVKIAFHKQDYSAFILKIFALCESFIKNEASKYLCVPNRNNQKSDKEILKVIERNTNLLNSVKLRVKELKNTHFEEPLSNNPFTYIAVCEYFDKEPKCNSIFIYKTLLLRNLRNNIAHYARNFAVDEIQNIFFEAEPVGSYNDSIDLYFQQGDKFWGVSSFGEYEIINDAIRTRILTNKTT